MKTHNTQNVQLAIRILSGGLMVYGGATVSTHADDTGRWTPTGTQQTHAQQSERGPAMMQPVHTALDGSIERQQTQSLSDAPHSHPAWINTPRGERVRMITRFEADAIGGSGALATGGATLPGGACTCDSQCAAAAGECRMAHCVGGLCVQSLAPVDTVCNNDNLFCTEERCNDAGVCINSIARISEATRISSCAKACCVTTCSGTPHAPCIGAPLQGSCPAQNICTPCRVGDFSSHENCFEPGDCPGVEGCYPKSELYSPAFYRTQCDEANDRCFVDSVHPANQNAAVGIAVGRCCSATGVCSVTPEWLCGAPNRWLRWRDPDDIQHACNANLGCPKYSSGIAPVDDPAMQMAIGPIVPFARRCAIGNGLCEVNADCITRCNGGTRLNEACDNDLDCPMAQCLPIDLCVAASNECQGPGTFTSIGDDYTLSNGQYMRLSEFRFRGGAREPNEVALFEFYDRSFAPPRLVNSFAFRLINPGDFDYRIIVDCSPNCDATQPQGTFGEEAALDPPFIIPPDGLVVMRATRLGAVLSPHAPVFGEDDGNLFWYTSVSAPDEGTNDPNAMWINGVTGNNAALGLDVLAFELLGEKLLSPPLAACCDSATGSCTQRLEWDCRFCTDPGHTPCARQRDCGLNNEFTCNSRDWKGAKTRAQVNSDAYRDCSGRYCFDPANPNPASLTPCTGTGQGTCVSGQTCDASCEKATCCVAAGPNAGCNEVTSAAQCNALGGIGADIIFGQKCTPNCCPQPNTGVDCCKDYYACSVTNSACTFRCSNNATRPCTEDFECEAPGTCNLLPGTQADCPGGNTCELECDGPNNSADPRIHAINVPTYVNGTEQVTRNFQGITAPAVYFDDCALGGADFGWYEVFTIGKVDPNDKCAEVTLNFCCSDPPISPVIAGLSRGCPCAGAETIFPDNNSLGQQEGYGAACNNDYCCTDGNYSLKWTMPAGTYVYGIVADKSCSNSTLNCFADADCDPGAWCRRNNAAYQGHIIFKPCVLGACCGAPSGGVAPFCSVTDQFICAQERKYCKSNQAPCADSTDCPMGDSCLPGVFLGNKEFNPVPECDGDPCTLGACCIGPGNCQDVSGLGIDFATCAASQGTYFGGFRCNENPCPVCPIETQDQCQTATTGQYILPNDRIIGVRRADDFMPAGLSIKRICFFPCFLGVTADTQGFECSYPGTTPPDSYIAKFYDDALGKPGGLHGGLAHPPNGYMLVVDAKLISDPGRSRCWRYTAPINPPLTVTPGSCLWIEVVGLGEQQANGLCLVHALSSADGNSYSLHDTDNNYTIADFDNTDLAFCIDSGIIGATSPPLSQDGGCGNFPAACCKPGATCIDGVSHTQCVGTNWAPVAGALFPYLTCAELATMGGCPVPENDDCADAEIPAGCNHIGMPGDPNLGVCSVSEGPPNLMEVCDMTVGTAPRHDCAAASATCGALPPCSVAFRCQFMTDNRLASTDGPNMQSGPGPTCFPSGVNSFQADIWYKYIAPCNGYMTVHSCGPNKTYDSMLQVFSANTPTCVSCPIVNNSQNKGCSDDDCGTNSSGSALRIPIVEDACYTIRMGGWSQLGYVNDASQNASGLDLGVVCNPTVAAPFPAVAPAPHNRRKNRYISFAPNSPPSCFGQVAFRVQKTTTPSGSCWVQEPVITPGPDQYTATCGANPVFRDWTEPMIHVGDCEIIPVADYIIFMNAPGPVENPTGLAVPTILVPSINGKLWGDSVGSFNGTEWTPPNQIGNVNDILAILARISGTTGRPEFPVANLSSTSSADSCLTAQVNTSDTLAAVQAVAGASYGPPSSGRFTTFAQCAAAPTGACPCCGN